MADYESLNSLPLLYDLLSALLSSVMARYDKAGHPSFNLVHTHDPTNVLFWWFPVALRLSTYFLCLFFLSCYVCLMICVI